MDNNFVHSLDIYPSNKATVTTTTITTTATKSNLLLAIRSGWISFVGRLSVEWLAKHWLLGWSIYQLERIFTWFVWIVLWFLFRFFSSLFLWPTFNRLDFTRQFIFTMFNMYSGTFSLLLPMDRKNKQTNKLHNLYWSMGRTYRINIDEFFLWKCNLAKLQLCSTACDILWYG